MYSQLAALISVLAIGRGALAIPASPQSTTSASPIDPPHIRDGAGKWSYPLPDGSATSGKQEVDRAVNSLSKAKRQASPGSGGCSHGTPAFCAVGIETWNPLQCTLHLPCACDGSPSGYDVYGTLVPVCCEETTKGIKCSALGPFVSSPLPANNSSVVPTNLTINATTTSSLEPTFTILTLLPANTSAPSTTSALPTLAASVLNSTYAIPRTSGPFKISIPVGFDYYSNSAFASPRRTAVEIATLMAGRPAAAVTTTQSLTLVCATSTTSLTVTTTPVSVMLPCWVGFQDSGIVGGLSSSTLDVFATYGLPPTPAAATQKKVVVPRATSQTSSSATVLVGSPCWADANGEHCG